MLLDLQIYGVYLFGDITTVYLGGRYGHYAIQPKQPCCRIDFKYC